VVPAQPKVIKNRQVDHARLVITLEENDHLGVAKVARDRECVKLGPICRQREDAVAERQRRLDAALQSVERRADPQTGTATQLVAWASFGQVRPTEDDFQMFRVLLLALLPQIGGLLLMISRSA
jgi:hypothetical protein